MLVIDAHVHLVDDGWVSDDMLLGMARVAAAWMAKATSRPLDAAMLLSGLKAGLVDPTGEKLIAAMDAAGVGVSCVFPVDYGLLTGEPGVPIEEQNRLIAEAVGRFPGRLVGFFAVDPRRPGSLDMFRRAVEEWGARGLKLHPSVGFFPYDEVVYPFYRACLEYGIPVLIHTGSQPAPAKSRFCRPSGVDDVAADFPGLSIIMAHAGHHWYEEALLVASVKPNCYVDISGWQREYLEHPAAFYRALRRVIDAIGPWRVFFGTDGPYLNVLCPLTQWVGAIRKPDLAGCPDVSFSAEEIEIIMGRAFARLIGLAEAEAQAG